MFASKDNPVDATGHQFLFHNTAALRFSQFNRTEIGITLINLFIDYINQLEQNSTLSKQSNGSTSHKFMLNTITTTVPLC